MKKLSKFNKCCIALAVGLFVAIWSYLYFPPQMCEVHGVLLRRGRPISYADHKGHGPPVEGSGSCIDCLPGHDCSHSGLRNESPGSPALLGTVFYCPICRKGLCRHLCD